MNDGIYFTITDRFLKGELSEDEFWHGFRSAWFQHKEDLKSSPLVIEAQIRKQSLLRDYEENRISENELHAGLEKVTRATAAELVKDYGVRYHNFASQILSITVTYMPEDDEWHEKSPFRSKGEFRKKVEESYLTYLSGHRDEEMPR